MKIKYNSLLSFGVLSVLITCNEENTTPVHPPIRPDPKFYEYVDRFVSEASAREAKIDVEGLVVGYTYDRNIVNGEICGYGSKKKVDISPTPNCWVSLTDIQKEMFIFHELGHAVLNRQHDYTVLPSGAYKSIMHPSAFVYSEDTRERRKYYLDEMFDRTTPPADWALKEVTPTVLMSDSIDSQANGWNYQSTNDIHVGDISSKFFGIHGSSLKISSPSASTSSSWVYKLWVPNGIKSSKLVLEVSVRVDAVIGNGAVIAFQGDAGNRIIFYATTPAVPGTLDFARYTVEIPNLENLEVINALTVYLILRDQSSGTVYFDDIKLISYQ